MAGEIFTIRSDKTLHFAGSLAQNNHEVAVLDLPSDIDLNAISSFNIEGVSIRAKQNLQWDVYLWSDANTSAADLDVDSFVDSVSFPSTSGVSIANGGGAQFYYPSADLDINYKFPSPNTLKVYVSIVNRSVVAKLAGVTGEVVVEIKCITSK